MNKTMNYLEMCCHHTLDFPSFFDSNSSRSSLHVLCRVLVACSWLMSRENGRVSGGEKNGNEPPQAQVNTNGRQKPSFPDRPGPHSVSNFVVPGLGILARKERAHSPQPAGRLHFRHPRDMDENLLRIGLAFLSLLFAPSLRRASRPRLLMSGFNS